jgi:hypothetical protein
MPPQQNGKIMNASFHAISGKRFNVPEAGTAHPAISDRGWL